MNANFTVDAGRLLRQKQGLEKVRDNGYKGTLQYVTGLGKTYCGVLLIQHLKKIKPDLFTIVVVPTDPLRTDWKKYLAALGITKVYVDTVHSLVKKSHICDLLIVDEIHSYTGGEVFSTLFDCVNRSYTLGLTARERDKPEDKKVVEENCPIVDTIDYEEALDNNWISPFIVYNLEVPLAPQDFDEYYKINKLYHKYFSTFDYDFNVAMRCLKNKDYRQRWAGEMNMAIEIINSHTFQFNKIMRTRKDFIYNSDAVFQKTVEIAKRFSDKKIITFSETTQMVDRLTAAIPGSAAYHSSLKTQIINGKKYGKGRLRKAALEKFKSGEIRVLNSARALNMGQDIPEIDMSIKSSFNSTVIDSIQRLGRTLRKNKDKVAIEVNMYIAPQKYQVKKSDGTITTGVIQSQSKKWLMKSQETIPNVRWITSIDQINTYHQNNNEICI